MSVVTMSSVPCVLQLYVYLMGTFSVLVLMSWYFTCKTQGMYYINEFNGVLVCAKQNISNVVKVLLQGK